VKVVPFEELKAFFHPLIERLTRMDKTLQDLKNDFDKLKTDVTQKLSDAATQVQAAKDAQAALQSKLDAAQPITQEDVNKFDDAITGLDTAITGATAVVTPAG
jgi:ABC-type transporter Mla subunit MlaD